MKHYAMNLCVSRWNERDTMDVINFFISRPGGLTHEKVWISWKNYFFLIWLLFILNIYLKLTNHRYFMIKNQIFFTIHNKNGAHIKNGILSLNDLTPSPISQPGTHCLQWQRANTRANLWWRHQPFPGKTSIALRPCAGKAGVTKRSWWSLGIIPSNRCCQFRMINQILEEIYV